MQRALLGDAGPAAPVLLIIIILAFQTAALANDAAVSILYYESIRLAAVPETSRQTAGTTNDPASLRFDAYGRRFELQNDDTRIVRGSGFTRLSGQLTGLPGSWFRLIRHNEELSGIIADGTDTWLIEPRRRVADLLVEAPAYNAPTNIIYRLADTLMPEGLLACATPHDAATVNDSIDGQSAFNKLGAELQSASGNASLADNLHLSLGIVADKSFVNHNRDESESEVTLIFNTVQGIFANELGIEIEIDDVFLITPDVVNPFSDTTVAVDLLGELADWRSANHTNLGLTHLLTRRNLIGEKGRSLAGLSYFGQAGRSGVCNPTTGASLSSDVSGLTALIIAHEIGHNMGAPHDGEGACAAEPDTGFIMGSRISRQTEQTFSKCSIRQMDKVIAAASCLNPTTQSLSATSGNPAGGGGSALGWLSIPGLIASLFLRRRRPKVPA